MEHLTYGGSSSPPPAVTGVTAETIAKLSDADLIAGTAQQYDRARESYRRTREEICTLLEFGNGIVSRFKMERIAGEDRDGQPTVHEAFKQAGWSYDAYRKAKSRFTQNLLPEYVKPPKEEPAPTEGTVTDIEIPPAISHDGHIRGGKRPGYFDIPLTEQEKLINLGRKMADLILNKVKSEHDFEKRLKSLNNVAQDFIKLLDEQRKIIDATVPPPPASVRPQKNPSVTFVCSVCDRPNDAKHTTDHSPVCNPLAKGRRNKTKAVPVAKGDDWKPHIVRKLGGKFAIFRGNEVAFTADTMAWGTYYDTEAECEPALKTLDAKYAPKAEEASA
jgi:hypothetical protein